MTQSDQWTKFCQGILNVVTIDRVTPEPSQRTFAHPEVYPYRQLDAEFPNDATGFVYCLYSVSRHKIYIGETHCLTQRYNKHNNGTGAVGTRDPRDRPWSLAAYICGLAHMGRRERMSLERAWKELVRRQQLCGRDVVYDRVMCGERVVQIHNNGCAFEEDHIRFVPMITADAVDPGRFN